MSRDLEDSDVAALTLLLSPERLAAYSSLTGSPRLAIELHQQTLDLSAMLMVVTASIELALRNAVSENLTAFFGTPGWLTHPPAPFQWRLTENQHAQKALESARRSTYATLNQSQKAALDTQAFPSGRPPGLTHSQRSKRRRQNIIVTNGKIIAETTFFFWKRLYSADYEQSLWRPTLKRTFPNKQLKRAHVAEKLEVIYQARNRIAHHEPVLHRRFDDTIKAISFICENLGVATPNNATPLAKLVSDDLEQVKQHAKQLHDRLNSYRQPQTRPAATPPLV